MNPDVHRDRGARESFIFKIEQGKVEVAVVIPTPTSLCEDPFAYAALRVSSELLLGFFGGLGILV
jgi:hypothetical protein